MSTLSATDVSKRYGDVTALDGLSVEIDGGLVGLLGTNGAGKTTLFKLLLGLDRPDAGTLTVAGRPPTAGTDVRERVGYLPENAAFPPSLTGREVLAFHARVRGVPASARDRRVEQVLGVVGLVDAGDRAVGGYSNGMIQRLGLGTAIVADPDVLLLDEPTAGLDPLGMERFHAVVERLADGRDLTVVFASHALAEVERLCDRVVVVHDGDVTVKGPIDELRAGVGTPVVTARFADADVAADAADRLVGCPRVATVERTGARLTVTTNEPYPVVESLHETITPQSFEVESPDLDAVFEAAVGGEPA